MDSKDICKWYDMCPLKSYYERQALDKQWIENYCWGDYSNCVRYKMEESGVYHPDNMLPDGTIDEKLK
ncbi:MAG: uracil-DNA glycosylase [Candidatus Omnitrophota bacterium]|jgi:hypothetical protein|nr:MAG: uracil-DNA glycosylase [Candidatus Omnitrophota bacterium]